MHPSSAYLNYYPYGKGEYFLGRPPVEKICCCRIRISYDSVLLYSNIKLIGLPYVYNYEIVVWDFEIPTMKKCYVNLDIKYIDGYAYKKRPLKWRKYYEHNYYKRLQAKAQNDAFNVLYYKLLNNSSYGKLLEKPHNEYFENIIGYDGIITSNIIQKDDNEITSNARYTYLPVGSGIPARSRVTLIELALKIGYENVVYFDTDSIFFIANEKSLKAWSEANQKNELGGWALEEILQQAQFTAPKRYKAITDKGDFYVKSGGINFDKYIEEGGQMNFEEVNIISSKWKVQRAYRVKGGTIIDFQEKEMTIPKKYLPIYEENKEDLA